MTDTTTPSFEQSPGAHAGPGPGGQPDPAWPGPAPAQPHTENRFFAWMRGRGIPRRNGWMGGVCSGLAVRMGVDPLIVRGIFVVAALLGLPALLIYAIAWALMPDEDGRIHLEQLFRGRFEPAMIGVVIMALVGFVPVVPLMFNRLYSNGLWGHIPAPDFILGSLLFIGLVVWLIVWIARSTARRRAFSLQMDAAAQPASSDPVVTSAVDSETPRAEAPPAMPSNAAPEVADDATEWREQQQTWREQHDAWRRAQADADRAAREQARTERNALNAAFAAESNARRAQRRATNPRANGAFVLAVIGSCLVLGTGFGLFTMNGALGAYALAIGLLVAAATAAFGMIVAGLLRRRSGFLAFFTAALLALGLAAPAVTDDRVLFLADAYYMGHTSSATFLQPWSTFQLDLHPNAILPADDTINLIKGTGWTYVIVRPGVELDLRAQFGNVTLITERGVWDGRRPTTKEREAVHAEGGTLQTSTRKFSAATLEEGASGELRTVTLNLEQRGGDVTVIVVEPDPSETPSETTTQEDGA